MLADLVGVGQVLVWPQVVELLAVVHAHVHLQDCSMRTSCERWHLDVLSAVRSQLDILYAAAANHWQWGWLVGIDMRYAELSACIHPCVHPWHALLCQLATIAELHVSH
jgi:hypothetical protein